MSNIPTFIRLVQCVSKKHPRRLSIAVVRPTRRLSNICEILTYGIILCCSVYMCVLNAVCTVNTVFLYVNPAISYCTWDK